MPQKVIHVGVGVFGKRWCTEFLKTNIADRTIEVVAVVDSDPAALAYGREAFGLPPERCYSERCTAILAHRKLELFMRQDIWRQQHREGQGQKIAVLWQPKWINHWLIEQFVKWRAGGPPMATRVSENVQASALVRHRKPAPGRAGNSSVLFKSSESAVAIS